MFTFDFRLTNTFSDRWGCVFARSKLLGNHKAVELNAYSTNVIVSAELSISTRRDHAGIHIMLGLLGKEIEFHYYDTRHWDDETNTWVKYDD